MNKTGHTICVCLGMAEMQSYTLYSISYTYLDALNKHPGAYSRHIANQSWKVFEGFDFESQGEKQEIREKRTSSNMTNQKILKFPWHHLHTTQIQGQKSSKSYQLKIR